MILTGCLADANVNPSGSWGLFYSGHEGVFAKNLVRTPKHTRLSSSYHTPHMPTPS